MTYASIRLAFAASITLLAACGGAAPEAQTPASNPSTAPSPSASASATSTAPPAATTTATKAPSLDVQVALGGQIFASKCASCHGAKGEGDASDPPVIGAKALPTAPPKGAKLRKGEFKNAADVIAFVMKKMPMDDPGSLNESDATAVVAYEIKMGGVDIGAKPLDATGAKTLSLH